MTDILALQALSGLPTPLNQGRPVVWVGGAMDHYTQLLKRHCGKSQHYFQWYQQRELADWLQAQPQQALLIGHSYGACTAATVVASGIAVAELVTIDPVSWRKPPGSAVRRYAGLWRNYLAGDQQWNWANSVARAGGQWQHWPAKHAHQHQVLAADHATVVAAVLQVWRPQPVSVVAQDSDPAAF